MKPEELYDELENGVKSIEQELEIRTRAAEDHTRIFQEYKREVNCGLMEIWGGSEWYVCAAG